MMWDAAWLMLYQMYTSVLFADQFGWAQLSAGLRGDICSFGSNTAIVRREESKD